MFNRFAFNAWMFNSIPATVETLVAAVREMLVTDDGVSAITTGVYPYRVPQDRTIPALTYRLDERDYGHDLQGGDGLARQRFALQSHSTNYLQSLDLAEAARVALQGYTGQVGTVDILAIILTEDEDQSQRKVDGTDRMAYVVEQVFTVTYRVAIPRPT